MRISMVSEHASPLAAIGGVDAGGQNVHVAALSSALAGRGHDVVVLAPPGGALWDVARRFGLTVRFVEGRLRLAGLAPVVFEALGAGEITLDVAKAYAATPDQERQAFVFEQASRARPMYVVIELASGGRPPGSSPPCRRR